MGNTLIIAEKPSVAKSIVSALGGTITKQDGYFETSNGYLVTYAFGHLFNLADMKDYIPDSDKTWDLQYYPFVPDKFIYKPLDDAGVKRQIEVIRELANKADIIINACDSDREGQLIFAEIFKHLNLRVPVKRLWLTSHTPRDIEKGMNSLKTDMSKLEAAGFCRQQVDWIIGINLTVVYTLKTGGAYTLRCGRVLLPTLKLIYDRETDIINFVSKPFYMLMCRFAVNNDFYIGTYINNENISRFDSKVQLTNIRNNILNQPGTIIRKESNTINEYAPKLFSLTDLQGHITNKFKGFSSDGVLDVCQSLYEKRYLSYPRTASRHLDNSQVDDVRDVLKAVLNIPALQLNNKSDVVFHTEKRVFDSSKVDSHPAIIPTYIVPDMNALPENERIIYIEVLKRFVAQFMPAAIYDTLKIVTRVKEYDFITKGKVLVSKGWKQLYNKQIESETEDNNLDAEQEETIKAKNLSTGMPVISSGTEIKEGKTKPPAHYTEKTLLSAMENCGKNVENMEDVLKGFTIGTPATRADTIQKLIKTGYVYKKGKNLLITELGTKVILYFPVKRLLKVEFTGQIEKTLKDIENGQYDSKAFMEKMAAYITKNINDMKGSSIPAIPKQFNVLGKCPDCGRNVIETAKAFSCEGTRDNLCKFVLWKDDKFFKHFGKKMTQTIAKALITKNKAFIKGLKSQKKEGVTFDAIVHIKKDPETKYYRYELDFTNSPKGKTKKK